MDKMVHLKTYKVFEDVSFNNYHLYLYELARECLSNFIDDEIEFQLVPFGGDNKHISIYPKNGWNDQKFFYMNEDKRSDLLQLIRIMSDEGYAYGDSYYLSKMPKIRSFDDQLKGRPNPEITKCEYDVPISNISMIFTKTSFAK